MLSLCIRCGAQLGEGVGDRCASCAPSTLETTVALATATSPTGRPTRRSLTRAARATRDYVGTREDGIDFEWDRAINADLYRRARAKRRAS